VSRRDKVVTLAIAGALLLGIAIHATAWWSDGVARFGLRKAKLCTDVGMFGGMACRAVAYDDTGPVVIESSFVTYARLAYWLGFAAMALLLVHAYLFSTREETRAGWGAAGAAALAVLFAFAAHAALPGDFADDLSRGWCFWAALVGAVCAVGSVVTQLFPTAMVLRAGKAADALLDHAHRRALGPLADVKPTPSVPEARVVTAPPPTHPSPLGGEGQGGGLHHQDRISQAARQVSPAVRTPAAMPRMMMGSIDRARMQLNSVGAVRKVAVDALAEALRFVARDCTLGEAGLRVTTRRGAERRVAWTEIERVVLRHLPPEEPYRGAMLLDLVVRGSAEPVRLLPTTQLDFAALPAAAGTSSVESFRKLAQHAAAHGAALDASAPSFRGASEFLAYDAGYG
jgi:hypothetical protein